MVHGSHPFTNAYNDKNVMVKRNRLWGFYEAQASRFQDNRHMQVVRLSADKELETQL